MPLSVEGRSKTNQIQTNAGLTLYVSVEQDITGLCWTWTNAIFGINEGAGIEGEEEEVDKEDKNKCKKNKK